jgi:hypothetical protein
VIETPDTILLSDERTGTPVTSLVLSPGQTVDLKATAVYKKLALTAQDTCFVWTAEGAAGRVDPGGIFTAADQTGTGNLTVSVGGRSVTIPVSVVGHVLLLEDFEDDLTSFVSTVTAEVSLQAGAERVRYGKGSMRLDYDTATGGAASAAAFLTLASGEKYLNLWVYGDGSGNTLTATRRRRCGRQNRSALAGLDFTGWKYVTAALPAGATGIAALNVFCGGGSAVSGTVYLDQITTSNEVIRDETPPVVTVSLNDGVLTAVVSDAVTRTFAKDRISLTRDGIDLDFTWDAAVGTATAQLPPGDGKLHRITVTATDLCGNIGRGSVDLWPAGQTEPGETGQTSAAPFTDMEGHWSEAYAAYLYDHAITNGIAAETGLQFQPEKQITRGEFFLMVSRWKGLDLNAYAAVTLPFDDQGAIADWMLPGVKAMYALGILKGSRDGAALNANAAAAISRAEAMALLGRIQPRGYAEPELAFDDSGAVPAWAAAFVKALVGQGVVGGYGNKVYPANAVKRGEVAKMLYTIR